MAQNKASIRFIAALLVLLPMLLGTGKAMAAPLVDVTADRAALNFPESVSFHVRATSAHNITSLVLEYGDTQKTCGQVLARVYPQFTPGSAVEADWTWDMRQSGSLPPGAQLWWRWRITDDSGAETVTEQKTVAWLDNTHKWDLLVKGAIRLHWYNSHREFALELLDAAHDGILRVEQDAGLTNDQPVDIYIYASNQDMQDAVLYEPSWTGGQAYARQNIVIIGIAPPDVEWGKRAVVHELTHVLVGHFAFTCLGSVPTWLNEGLAVYSEGPLEPASQAQLDEAIRTDTLLPVRSLSGPFSEVSSKASLSYSESFSMVNYLIGKYGRSRMNALLAALRDGDTIDEALRSVYSFNVDGLEDAWRASIGAQSRTVDPNPTAQPTPTFVPTIAPISGALPAVTPTPVFYPTLPAAEPTRTAPPLSLTLTLLCTCGTLALVVGVLILGLVLARQSKGDSNETRS